MHGFILCTWYLLFLLPLYVCYFYFTKPAKLIYFLTSRVRFHRFHFFSAYTNQLLSCIMYHYIVKSSKEYVTCITCNCKVQTFLLHPLLHLSFQRLLYCLYRPFHPKKYQTCSSGFSSYSTKPVSIKNFYRVRIYPYM